MIAGGGRLPAQLAEGLLEQGVSPFVLRITGEAVGDFPGCDTRDIALEAIADLVPMLRAAGATRAVFAGSISRRPDFRAIKFGPSLLPLAWRAARALLRGDDALLGALIGYVESRGIAVLGAHQVLPELLAPSGALTHRKPTGPERAAIAAGLAAARAIGALDIGQAAIAIGERAVAVEGAEGTAAMIERVRDLKNAGRIAKSSGGVLVKCAKPGQEARIDLPAIGPDTVLAAVEAGLTGIAVEAEASLILDSADTVRLAEERGLFIFGVAP